MGIMEVFTGEMKLGLKVTGETRFVPGNPDSLTPLAEIPGVKEATQAVLAARAKCDEAKAQLRPTSELTLAAITARGEFEQAERAVEAAEEVLRQVREREIARIFASRRAGRRVILEQLNAILERSRGACAELLEHDEETARLTNGRGWSIGAGDTHVFSPVMPDTPLMQSHLSAWQRALRTEGWL